MDYYDCECRIRHKDGSWVWVHDRGRVTEFDSHGTPLKMAGVHIDITARKKAEFLVQESEERYRALFIHAPIGIIQYDINGIVELCNDEFLRILHAERHEIVGLNMLGYIKDKKVIDAILDALEGKTGVYEGDYISVTSGRKVPLRGIFVGVPAGDGSTTTGIGIVIYIQIINQ